MNTHKIKNFSFLCAVAYFVIGSALCEQTSGQVEGATMTQPVDKTEGIVGNDINSMLQQPHIRRDLELSPDQVDQLSKVRSRHDSTIKDMMTEYRRTARELEPSERSDFMRKLAEKRKQSQEEMETEIGEILLPFQIKRMEQIKVQNLVARLGDNAGSPILHPMFRDKLNLTKEEEERIRAKILEVKKKLDDDIAELRRKANEEVLGELTEEQRRTYDEIIGEPLKKAVEIDR